MRRTQPAGRRVWRLSTKDRLLIQVIVVGAMFYFLIHDLTENRGWHVLADLAVIAWAFHDVRKLRREIRARRNR